MTNPEDLENRIEKLERKTSTLVLIVVLGMIAMAALQFRINAELKTQITETQQPNSVEAKGHE